MNTETGDLVIINELIGSDKPAPPAGYTVQFSEDELIRIKGGLFRIVGFNVDANEITLRGVPQPKLSADGVNRKERRANAREARRRRKRARR